MYRHQGKCKCRYLNNAQLHCHYLNQIFYAKVIHFSAHFGFCFNIFLKTGQLSAWQPGK